MTATFRRHFMGASLFTLLCLAAAAAYGWHDSHSIQATLSMLWIVAVLAVLEVSLSFDNAVVNAAVLGEMEVVWRKRFLTWGMVIAVFGARVLFPLAIVGVGAGLGPVEAVRLSLQNPEAYERIVSGAHVGIAGFGGAFLALVGLGFFMDPDKDVHWLGMAERSMARMGGMAAVEIALVLAVLVAVSRALAPHDGFVLLSAGVLGIVTFILVEGLGELLESRNAARAVAGVAVRSGLGSFLYLNVLDTSFSLDGVIGAFALSNNMVVIALGLSIGAIFVRSLTMLLVEKGTLSEYRYLEHGAFWAIIALGGIMLASTLVEIPDVLTGLVGAVLIAAALGWSMRDRLRANN
jgi:hypothetical protein